MCLDRDVGDKMKLKEALEKLKKESKKRKFDQSVDLIVNLRGIDVKRENVNIIVTLPNKVKDKKVAAFLKEKNDSVPTITEMQFVKYKDKALLKNLVKNYDYFIAQAPLMPKVATVFGKVLGPAGKMPSPQLGILMKADDEDIKKTMDKIATSLKIRMKEASMKVIVGKEGMDDEKIAQNIEAVYRAIENALPKKKDNVKNVMVKLTMGKPEKVEM